MSYQKKEGDCVLFVNDKQGVEKRPDFKGTAFLNGKNYNVSLWKKTDKNNKVYFSGMIVEQKQI